MSTILPSEVGYFLSAPTASSGNTGTGVIGNSRGKYLSVTPVNVSTTINNLFTDATGQMNAAQEVDYQCVFICNNTATGFTMKNPVVWMPTQFVKDFTTTVQIGMDTIGVVPQTGASAQASIITSQTQPPSVVKYSFPDATMATGVVVPDIPPAYCVAIWVKRILLNQGPTPVNTPDGVAITVSFQSNA